MAMANNSFWMHKELYKQIGDEIPKSSQDFRSLCHFIPLSARDKAENSGSVEDLLTRWEAQGGISLGNYDPLLKLLRVSKLIKVLSIAKAQVVSIKIQLDIEKREGASTAVDPPAPPNDFPSSDATLLSSDDPTKDHLQIMQRELQSWYTEVLTRLHPIQWSDMELDLGDIYTNLEMKPGRKHQLSKGSPTLSSMFNTSASERILCFVEGQAGIGKSTWCKHIVYLWSKNKFSIMGYSFDLTFLLEAHMLTGNLKQCIKENLFPNDFLLSEETIYEYVRNHQDKCLLVIDGMDELTPDGVNTVMELVKGNKLRHVHLILTGRPQRSRRFVNNVKIHLQLQGFSFANVKAYTCKYFHSDDNNVHKKLRKKLKTDRTLREIMTNPLTTLLVCHLAVDNLKLRLKLNRFSDASVNEYICKHFHSDDNNLHKKLLNKLKKDRTLLKMMTNPLHAVLVCWLVEDNKRCIPARSNEIQSQVLQAICKKYVTSQEASGSVDLTEHNLLSAAALLAYNGLKEGIEFYPEQTLASFCPDGFSDHLVKSGLLNKYTTVSKLQAEGFFYFPHKLFQEFLCQKYLSELPVHELNDKLASLPILPKYIRSELMMVGILLNRLQCRKKTVVVFDNFIKKLKTTVYGQSPDMLSRINAWEWVLDIAKEWFFDPNADLVQVQSVFSSVCKIDWNDDENLFDFVLFTKKLLSKYLFSVGV